MEVGLIIATFVMSALSALCSVASLTILLVITPRAEGETLIDAEERVKKPPDTAEEDDVEKRRRAAVEAKENQNFMDYDGTVQNPIDHNLILADGG